MDKDGNKNLNVYRLVLNVYMYFLKIKSPTVLMIETFPQLSERVQRLQLWRGGGGRACTALADRLWRRRRSLSAVLAGRVWRRRRSLSAALTGRVWWRRRSLDSSSGSCVAEVVELAQL